MTSGTIASSTAGRLSPREARQVAAQWLDRFAAALASDNVDSATLGTLFRADGYWRDMLALTWDLRTFAGPEPIAAALNAVPPERRPGPFRLADADPDVFERKNWGPTIEAFFTFETDLARCRGHLRLLRADQGDGAWKAWTVATSLEDLQGHEERAGANRPDATMDTSGPTAGQASAGRRPEERYEAGEDPEVLVIGAGQAGLSVAARLGQLDVPTLVVEREARVGDNWRKRYQSLLLHNQVWANHLPYLPFPATWPKYLTKDQVADWLEVYARILPLAVWTGTQVCEALYDDAEHRWSVTVRRPDGTPRTLHPRHIIMAMGVFGIPRRPEILGADEFEGALVHATEYAGEIPGPSPRVLVVGTGSSAHDVAQDLYQKGARVTLLQRSSTCVVSVEPGAARAYAIYREGGPPVEDADLVSNAFPLPLLAELHKELTERIAEMDRDLLEGLRNAGFAVDFGEDGSGFLMKYHRTGGGYYINTGCSDLIVAGAIAIKQGVEIERLQARSVTFTDGTSIEVDMVVVAAGYHNMAESVRAMFGDEVAARVGQVWGLDAEGEVRALWKRTGQPGLWLMGGSLQQCRPYSKYLALQIKGATLGLLP